MLAVCNTSFARQLVPLLVPVMLFEVTRGTENGIHQESIPVGKSDELVAQLQVKERGIPSSSPKKRSLVIFPERSISSITWSRLLREVSVMTTLGTGSLVGVHATDLALFVPLAEKTMEGRFGLCASRVRPQGTEYTAYSPAP